MKKIYRSAALAAAVLLLLNGCAAVPAGLAQSSVLPAETSSEMDASSAEVSSAQALSSSEGSSVQEPSYRAEASSAASGAESTPKNEATVSALSQVLALLQRTGAAEQACAQAENFVASAEKSLAKSAQTVSSLLELCSAPDKTDGLASGIDAAVAESKLPREAFQLAAAACRERGKKKVGTVTLTFTGDCTFSPINEQSHSGTFDRVYAAQKSPSYPFDRMFPWFATDDITCINFEGTLTRSLAHADKTYYFRGDPSLAKILPSSSVELADLANNHTMDYFQRGYDDTKAALSAAGVCLITVRQPYVAVINGIETVVIGQQMAWGAQAAVKTVRQYKRADNIVVVVMHWGTEFSDQAASACVEAGHALIDAGADLVVGHHPHVLQGAELYKNKYIFYSLGNFAFGANVGPVTSPDTMALRARFALKNGTAAMTETEIVPCCPTSASGGWNNYQPKPLFGAEAREIADYVVSISASLPYGVKKLAYFSV